VTTPLARRLADIVGEPHVLTGVGCSPYVVDGRTPLAVVAPGRHDEVAAALRVAGEEGLPVTPWGGGTKVGIGAPPARPGVVVSLHRLDRLVEHEPGDLTATLQAGMTLGALQEALGRHGQWLSLDAAEPERATLGGILAANAAGPRRHLYGTARDLLLGVTVVLADGTVVKGGGKVVKNVAGYDLPRLLIGSFGTLGVIVEATVKLRPRPDVDALIAARFGDLAAAGEAVKAVMASDLVPSALDLADGEAVRAAGLGDGKDCAVILGLDGLAAQVAWQREEIDRLLPPLGMRGALTLDGQERDRAWASLGRLAHRAFPDAGAVMRWGVLPVQVSKVMSEGYQIAARQGLRAAFRAHAGVGSVSAVLSAGGGDAGAVVATLEAWRALVAGTGGHALLEWAPLAVKEQVPVWDAPGAAQRIMARLKAELDPQGLLNPGRFVGGI
jgi:glycolate oxidase FAD binding subunit